MLNHGFCYREQAGADSQGVLVAAYLARHHPHSSLARWEERLSSGEVEVEGHRATVEQRLKAGEWVAWHRPPWDEPEVPLAFAVLFEDEHLLAVNKPAGLPSMPAGGFLENTLLHQVRRRSAEWSPLHRLGRGTSGIVLFARGHEALNRLSGAWREHQAEKRYLAVASGRPSWSKLTIEQPIGPVPYPALGELHAASATGRAARSDAEVLALGDTASLVAVRITTGRPHQIRIHLAWAGHPLEGDPLYGVGGVPAPGITALPGDVGYRLHAHRLTVAHPVTGAELTLQAQPPPGYAAH